MITQAQFEAWLLDSTAQRVVLYEIEVTSGGNPITRYLSDKQYINAPVATPYSAIVSGSIAVSAKISLSAEASVSIGALEIDLTAGRQSWFKDVWKNRKIRMYIGDTRWDRADFKLYWTGIVGKCAPKDRYTLALSMVDKLQQLNTPISEKLLGGTTTNKNSLIPLCFGECHNVTPLMVGPNKYQIHDGPVENIFEVRDNGKPVLFTADHETGTFTLNQKAAGVITCSVQGDKFGGVYRNTITNIIRRIATGFGKLSDRFSNTDLDTANLDSFETANPHPVGIYIKDRTNVIEVCRQLASSVRAQMVVSREGLLQLIQINFPTSATTVIKRAHQFDDAPLTLVDLTEPVAAIKLGYCKNYTVQDNLLTTLPEEHKDLYKKEWLEVVAKNQTVADLYKLNQEPAQRDTCIIVGTSAQTEANRQLVVEQVARGTYTARLTANHLMLTLGQAVQVFADWYDLENGAFAVVTGVTPDINSFEVNVEVMI